MRTASKVDERYMAYIRVVDACSGTFTLDLVKDAMRRYALVYAITPSGIQSIARGIIANSDEMIHLAIHRWRTASDNFSVADHNVSLAWRAKHDPVYIAYYKKRGIGDTNE